MRGGEPKLKLWRGSYAVVWRESGQTRRSALGTADREAAETGFADWKHKRRVIRPEGILTVGRLLRSYHDTKPEVIERPILEAYFRNHLPEHVTQDETDEYAKARKASPSTVKTELGLLRTALRFAAKRGWIDPIAGFELPAGSPPRERWITKTEADRLIESAAAPHIKLFITIARWTGARAGAILDLTWDRVGTTIDFQPPERTVTRKRRAVVPVSPQLREALQAANAGALSDYVIEFSGERVLSVKRGFRNAVTRAKLKAVTPHTLRHSVATWLAMDGVSMRKIADLLGHTSVDMVERVYAKFAPGYLADVVESLNSAPEVQVNRSDRGKPRTAAKTKTASRKKHK